MNYSSSHEHGLSHCATCILGKCEKLYWAEGILEGKGKKKKRKAIPANGSQGTRSFPDNKDFTENIHFEKFMFLRYTRPNWHET